MIEIRIGEKKGKILEITCTGHANDTVEGSDLLCALLSSINTHTINIFTDLLHLDQMSYSLESGFFEIRIKESDYTEGVDIVMRSLDLYYRNLYRSFEKYIKIFYMEV